MSLPLSARLTLSLARSTDDLDFVPVKARSQIDVIVADRAIRIDVFPVGIETAAFADLAQRSVHLPFVKGVIGSLAGVRAVPPNAAGLAGQSDLSTDRNEKPHRDFWLWHENSPRSANSDRPEEHIKNTADFRYWPEADVHKPLINV